MFLNTAAPPTGHIPIALVHVNAQVCVHVGSRLREDWIPRVGLPSLSLPATGGSSLWHLCQQPQSSCQWLSASLHHFFNVLICSLFPRERFSFSFLVKAVWACTHTRALSKVMRTEAHGSKPRYLGDSLDSWDRMCPHRKERKAQLMERGIQTVKECILK